MKHLFKTAFLFFSIWLHFACNNSEQTFVGHNNPPGASDEYTADSVSDGTDTADGDSASNSQNDFNVPNPDNTPGPGENPENPEGGTPGTEDQVCALETDDIDFVNFPWPADIKECYNQGKLYDFYKKSCGTLPSVETFDIAKSELKSETDFNCNWEDVLTVENDVVFGNSESGSPNPIGSAEKNDKAKIVGCSEVKDSERYMMVIQYWYPTNIDKQECKVASNWRIYTSCRELLEPGVTKEHSWEECLRYEPKN